MKAVALDDGSLLPSSSVGHTVTIYQTSYTVYFIKSDFTDNSSHLFNAN